MAKLSMSTPTIHKQPVRTRPSKYATSPIRRELEQGDAGGMRPVGAFYPWKYLPVQFEDTETGDWVAILKGTIVSIITNQVRAVGSIGSVGISGSILDITSSGTIPVFDDATLGGATLTALNIDDSYWGYHDSAVGLLIPANGGNTGVYTYAANDVTAGVTKPDTLLVVQNGDTITVPANIPAGVVFTDVYQDIRGYNLNYDLWASMYGILTDGLLFVPYVDVGLTTPQSTATFDNGLVTDFTVNTTDDAGYNAVYKKHPFLYIESAQDTFSGESGMLVTSDAYGKFIPQGARGSLSRTTSQTAQTVGRILYTDSRFPKDNADIVQVYPASALQGNETGGVREYVYNFAKDAMTGMALTTGIANVVDMVQAGAFGSAAIELDVAG